ncbi:PtsGHI operon antiterminator [Corynebacterium felinum]|nr:PtsGHI operon antiterminator [Corynebacterium felinum]
MRDPQFLFTSECGGFRRSLLDLKVGCRTVSNTCFDSNAPLTRAARVLSNNAVLVTTGDVHQVLVGRGIGFGVKVGDTLAITDEHQRFVHLTDEQAQFFESLRAIDGHRVEKFSTAVDLAADILGPLHPSVYVLLVEHLSFAVDRLRRGEGIFNAIAGEIKAVFPDEFAAAEVMLQYINSHLDNLELPHSEAGFIALHLNAALGGTSVKAPLAQANQLAELVAFTRRVLGIVDNPAIGSSHDDGLELTIARLIRRVRKGAWRRNDATMGIGQQLTVEFDLAQQVICRILSCSEMPAYAKGEAAFLAVFLHGCVQECELSRDKAQRQN